MGSQKHLTRRRMRECWRPATCRLVVLAVAMMPPLYAQKPVRLISQETSLGERRADTVERTMTVSAALRLAYVAKRTGGEAVVLDGVAGRVYTMIPSMILTEAGVRPPVNFSPDGKRVAYVARKGESALVVVDSSEGPLFDRVEIGAPVFSSDSRRVAYFAQRSGKQMIVVDGVEGAAYDDMNQQFPKFTSDSKHVVYTAQRGRLSYVVLDSSLVDSAEYVSDPELSDSGGRLAYMVKRGEEWAVVVDRREGKRYRSLGNNLVFSADGRHFLYQAHDSLAYVVVDGVQGPGFASIKENSYNFSHDGAHVAYAALQDDGQLAWVLDGVKGTPYRWLSTEPAFSPDGRRLTYVAAGGDKRFVVMGTREGEPFDEIIDFPRFAPDGRVVYVARRGKQVIVGVDSAVTSFDAVAQAVSTPGGRVVVVARRGTQWHTIVDGVAGKPYAEPPSTIATSPDGRRVAYVAARDSAEFVVLNGIEGTPYGEVSNLRFSTDGKHVIYSAKRLAKYVVVVDGVESPAYDEIFFVQSVSDMMTTTSLGMLARRGRGDLRVTLHWSK